MSQIKWSSAVQSSNILATHLYSVGFVVYTTYICKWILIGKTVVGKKMKAKMENGKKNKNKKNNGSELLK